MRLEFGACLLLAACVAAGPFVDRPSRAEAEQALAAWMHCEDGIPDCIAPDRRPVLRSLRCAPVEEVVLRPARLLCHFSGRMVAATGSRSPLAFPCAYLRRDAEGEWIVDSFPDADLCEPA